MCAPAPARRARDHAVDAADAFKPDDAPPPAAPSLGAKIIGLIKLVPVAAEVAYIGLCVLIFTSIAVCLVAVREARHMLFGVPPKPLKHKRMRLLLAVEQSPIEHVSGLGGRFLRIMENLPALGVDVLLIAASDKDSEGEYFGCQTIHVAAPPPPLPNMAAHARFLPLLSRRAFSRIHEFDPDVIHCAAPCACFGLLSVYAHARGIPFVSSFHTDIGAYCSQYLPPGPAAAVRFLYDSCLAVGGKVVDSMVAPSRQTADMLTNDVGLKSVGIWPTGIDTDQFSQTAFSTEMRNRLRGSDVEDGSKILVSVSRLDPEKNLYILRDILDELNAGCSPGKPNYRLAMIGDGAIRKELETYFANHPVVFTGCLHGRELAAAYASGHVFVTASTTETFGQTATEAMACGVPVVAAAAGGYLTNVAHRDTGMLFTPDSFSHAAEQTKALFADDALRESIILKAREHVKNMASWKSAAQWIVRRYEAELTL